MTTLRTPEKIADLFLGIFKEIDVLEEAYYDVVLEYAGNCLDMKNWSNLYETAEVRMAEVAKNMKRIKKLVDDSRLLSNTEMREKG